MLIGESDGCAGRDIIDELARRAVLGRYFTFAEYSRLRQIRDPVELERFLRNCGYSQPPIERDAAVVVDYLQQCVERRSRPVVILWRVLDALMWLIAILWLIWSAYQWVR